MKSHTKSNAESPGDGRRLIIVGLDGVTWNVLKPLMAEGRMPHLQAAVEGGTHGILHSTVPPITPAAWTTFLTGKEPGRHGIIDFERYDPATNRLAFNSTRCLDHVRSIWRLLSDAGHRVASINIPMTFPAVPVNGIMISGFETPGTESDFIYPHELKAELLQRWPDPTLKVKWRRKPLGGIELFKENLAYMSRSFHQGAALLRWCGERLGDWQAMMVVLKMTDNLQHKTWKHMDARWCDRSPRRRDLVKACWQEADRALGDMLDYAQRQDARVLIVSDHGHGSLEGKVQPNLLLQQWGYLHLHGGAAQGGTRVRHAIDRLTGKTKRFARSGDVLHDLAVDFSSTRACVMHAGMAGFLYVNLKGRQPSGIVDPDEFDVLRDELIDRFLGESCRAVDPRTGETIPLFTAAHKPEDLYNCSREEQPWLPDLMLIPYGSLAVVRKIRGGDAVRWLRTMRIEGTHRPEGIVVGIGDGIREGGEIEMRMADCAPTMLAMTGCPLPNDLDGRVASEMFEVPPQVTYEERGGDGAVVTTAAAGVSPDAAESEVYSEEDLAKITERLSDLGYLE